MRSIRDAELICLGQQNAVPSIAARNGESQIIMNGQHACRQFFPWLGLVPIPGAKHVRHQHDVILAGHDVRLTDRVLADALPVGLHENDRTLRCYALVIDDHSVEMPASNLVRHLLLRHHNLPPC